MGEPAERLRIAEETAAPAAKDLGWSLQREVREAKIRLVAKDVFAEVWRRSGCRPVPVPATLESLAAVVGVPVETIRRALDEVLDGLLIDILDRAPPGRSIGPALWLLLPRDPHDLATHRVLTPGPWRWLPGVEWDDPWTDPTTPRNEELAPQNEELPGNNSSKRGASSSNRGVPGATGSDLQQPDTTCTGGNDKEEEEKISSSSSLADRLAELQRRLWPKTERSEPGEREFLYRLAVLLGDRAHSRWLTRLVDKIEERKPGSPAGYGMTVAKDFAPAGCNTWQLFNTIDVPDEFRKIEVPGPPPAAGEFKPATAATAEELKVCRSVLADARAALKGNRPCPKP